MDRGTITDLVRTALSRISVPRFFESERGYQGALLAELIRLMPDGINPHAVVEQEYQKRFKEHGIRSRPDIIIHEPFDPSRHTSRTEANLAAIEIKRRARRREAIEDFESLSSINKALNYPFLLFINVDANVTYVESAPDCLRGLLTCFSVRLQNNAPLIEEAHHE